MRRRTTAGAGAAARAKKPPALARDERSVDLVDLVGERCRFVVVADTHSEPHPRALDLIARERPDRILHAGDIGDVRVVDRLAEVAPTWAIRGNIDGRGLPDVIRVDVTDRGVRLLRLVVLHIAVAGPRLRADAARVARSEEADLVVCGHSHVPFIGLDQGLTIFNPGSIGPRRFHLPIVFGVLDVARDGARMKHVSCETGEAWLP